MQNDIVVPYGSVFFRYQLDCSTTSQIGQFFLCTNQAILLWIKERKFQAGNLVSVTPHVNHSDLCCYVVMKVVTTLHHLGYLA